LRTWSLKTRILGLALCAVAAAAALGVLGIVAAHRQAVATRVADAPERLARLWTAETRVTAVRARALALGLAVDPSSIAPGPDTWVLVGAPDGSVASTLGGPGGEAPAGLAPYLARPGTAGLVVAGGAPYRYAVVGAPEGATVLVAEVVNPNDVAAWEAVAGGTLRFLDVPPESPAPAGLLPVSRVWAVTPAGPWVRLDAPPWPLLGPAWGLAAAALTVIALGIGLAASSLYRGLAEPLRAVEEAAARVAAGEPPGKLPTGGAAEVEAAALAVAGVREAIERRDRALDESARRLKTLQEEAVDPLYLFDRTGRVTDVNAKALALTGFDRETLLKRDIVSCVAPERPLQEEAYRRFVRCLDGTPTVFETRFATADGGAVPVEVSAGIIPNLEEATIQAFVRDISQRKRMETQLAQAEKMEGIGTLAGGIAHDFNNILGGILGYASLMKGLIPEDDRLYRYTDIIERSATRASELTQQLLGYARGGKYQVSRVRLNDVVQEVAAMLREGLASRAVVVDSQLDTHLPATEADAGQLHQVLTNLCVNARDAMPHGGRLRLVTESVQVAPGDPAAPPGLSPGRYVRLTVADTGEGMPPEVQRRMFEPFFTTKPPGEGTGLGLAMVYGIVRNHGGQIAVASRPGHGTAVRIYLPALEGTVQVLARPTAPVPGGKETVLVVDDELTILELAREILSQKGYGVVLARDGEEAVRLFGQYGESIGLAILDIVMPRMGGKETFKRLKAVDPDLKVIVSSGFSRHGQAQDLLEMGADAFVQKPYRAEDLASVVRRTLDEPPRAKEMVQSA
jgi:PAS domain S-box-containing protein